MRQSIGNGVKDKGFCLQFFNGLLHRADSSMTGNHNFLGQFQHAYRHSIPGGIAQPQNIVACLQHIAVIRFPVAGKTAQIKGKLQSLLLTGSQDSGLGKSRQRLVLFVHLPVGRRNIQLSYFLTGVNLTNIADQSLHRYLASLCCHTAGMNSKICIAQTKAEGIRRLHTKGIKVPISNVNTFLVVFIIEISVEIAVLIAVRQITVLLGPGVRELTGGRHSTTDHIRKRMAAFRTQLTQEHNRIDSGNLLGKRHINGTAAVDDQQKVFILFRTEADGFPFFIRQEQIAFFCFPVTAFTCLTADNVDTTVCIAGLHIRFGNRCTDRGTEIIQHHLHQRTQFQNVDSFFLFFLVS